MCNFQISTSIYLCLKISSQHSQYGVSAKVGPVLVLNICLVLKLKVNIIIHDGNRVQKTCGEIINHRCVRSAQVRK